MDYAFDSGGGTWGYATGRLVVKARRVKATTPTSREIPRVSTKVLMKG